MRSFSSPVFSCRGGSIPALIQAVASRCLSVLVLVLIVLLAPFCCMAEEGTDHRPLQHIRLQLKWRHQFQFAGYYAAIAKGYFADEGLRVELLEGRPGLDPVAELLSGRADYAIDSPAVVIKRAQGLPLVAVAAIFQHSPAVIISRGDSGLNTPGSLRGKRIMLTAETDPENLAMLMTEGIAASAVNIVPHTWSLEDLIAGRVEGQSAYLTNEPYLLAREGIEINTLRPLHYGIDFYGDCIITTEDEVRTNLTRLEAFRRAVQRGWVYAMDHQLEIAERILADYSQEKQLDQLLFEAEAMNGLIQPRFVEIGHMNPQRWRHITDTFIRLGMMTGEFDLQGFVYTDLLDQINTEKQGRLSIILISLGVIVLLGAILGLSLLAFNRKLAAVVRQKTASLQASEHHFRTFFELASVGVAQIDVVSGKFQRLNKKFSDIVGYSQEELRDMSHVDITDPEDRDNHLLHIRQLLEGKIREFTIEQRYIRKDGEKVWVFLTVSPLWLTGQQHDYVLAVVRDITARKNAEERLIFASKVFDNSIEGIVVTNAEGTILQTNPAFTTITGYQADEALGRNPRILKSDKHPPSFYEEMWQHLIDHGQWAGEIWNRRKNGEAYPEWLTISAVRNAQGRITNYVSLFHDISELVRQQAALEHLAQHDALTGLPNRILINDRLEMALMNLKRSGAKLALLFLDLDNFKHINDAFGHTAGDNLLVDLSRRLSNLMRTGDTVARMGGDEFLILLPDVDNINTVSLIAIRLIEALKQPFFVGDVDIIATGSIGVTIAPDDGAEAMTLVKNADIAMYRAKTLGRNNYQFFAPELDVQAHRRIALEMKLRKAFENEEFELYYQPLVHNGSGKIVGAEALIRWHSDGQLISPGEFIPMAEDSGLILPLGEWVIAAAALQAGKWQEAGYMLAMSVNISSRQFNGQDLVALLERVLSATNLTPGRLYLEVTESMIMGDWEQAQRIMGALQQLGVKFYLDDFGTGYSSLASLKRLPIDGLKIDRSFVKDIVEDADSRAIAAVIVSLAKTLDLTVVAEGVETEEQRDLLQAMDQMLIQGYLASRPVPAGEFEELLRRDTIITPRGGV